MMYNKLGTWWYKQCKKHKVLDWIDDNILWYVWDKPRDIYLTVRHWFYCNFNRYHWRLVKTAFKSYPWDGSFLLELEECQIDKQLHWFSHHQTMVDEQYNEIMRSLKWAKHCIHTLNNEHELYHYDGEMLSIPQIKDPSSGEWVDDPGNEDAELHRLDFTNHRYVYDGPYVNRRNAIRFMDKDQKESETYLKNVHDSDLYVRKARYLYYLIRERYTDLWWD
jgi:hypothetical protein